MARSQVLFILLALSVQAQTGPMQSGVGYDDRAHAPLDKRRARQYEESEFASQPVEMYPGVQQPVYAQPVYTQPMYGQPGYGPPVYVQDGYVQQSNGRSYGYDRGDGGRRVMRGGTVAAGVGGGLLGGLILGSALDGGGGDFGGGFESGDF